MAEYWQDVMDRAQATLPVWQQFSSLALSATTNRAFSTLITALPGSREGGVRQLTLIAPPT